MFRAVTASTHNISSFVLPLQLARSPTGSQRQLQTPPQRNLLPQIPLMEGVPFENNYTINSDDERDEESPPPSQRISQKQQGMVPYLESPAPIENMSPSRPMHQRKRLSFHLLYDGNEDNLARADDDNRGNVNANAAMQQELEMNGNPGSHRNSDSSNQHEENENGQDNTNSNQGSDHNEEHPLKKGTNHDSHKNTNSQEQSTNEGKQNGTKSNISEVATRVVKEATKSATRPEGMDTSASSNASSSSHSRGRTSRSNSVTSDGSASPRLNGIGGNQFRAAILPPLRISKDKRSKWLDHLNSFQESNHDVDLQMQEFIKVPGAVEKTLTSGFLICVDSFLYVCTILPIRFVWSCVLLFLYYFFKWTKKPAGKFQFHRR